ncbi:hypothetical protein FB548_1972 [Pseudoxanthomonas sp. 3HH-4]|uniref:hypothetical protein n=1 Tax=Pseudoxanthomonas sp. 3HH-4 TaxID=1690214 RepID=UPI00114EBE3D|nr:hypothetical protein [Pseudoxanthomonas sp. 3HH-4]TQM13118.1 hypothetical protein FB548_1972 [Pseudoxanthomonas sp. 3HH-4]
MKDHRRRLARVAMLLAPVLMLAACRQDAGTDPATSAPEATQISAEGFQQSLDGLWSTEESEGDDAETLYLFEWQADDGLRVVRDGAWLNGKVEDVDLDNGTLALHVTSDTGPSETVTVRKVPDDTTEGAFTLRITWGGGQTETLGFVRRLTARDREGVAEAIRAVSQQDPAGGTCETDAPAGSVRAALVCGQEEFGALDAGMRAQFKELADRYPDGDRTVEAATRQLDACDSPACLRAAYAQWRAYFDENYDLGDVVDYQ